MNSCCGVAGEKKKKKKLVFVFERVGFLPLSPSCDCSVDEYEASKLLEGFVQP